MFAAGMRYKFSSKLISSRTLITLFLSIIFSFLPYSVLFFFFFSFHLVFIFLLRGFSGADNM